MSALLGLLGERDVVQAPNRPAPVSYYATNLQLFQLLALGRPLFSIPSLSDDNDRVPYEHIGTVQPEDITISCAATKCSSPPYTMSQRYRFKMRLRLASTPRYPSYFPTKFSILLAIGQPSEAAVGPSSSFVEVLARVLRSCTHIHRQPRPWIHCSFLRAAKCATSFKCLLILRNQSIIACIFISLPSINTMLSIRSCLFPTVHKVDLPEPRPCARRVHPSSKQTPKVSRPLKSALELVVEATRMSRRTCRCAHFRDQSSPPN